MIVFQVKTALIHEIYRIKSAYGGVRVHAAVHVVPGPLPGRHYPPAHNAMRRNIVPGSRMHAHKGRVRVGRFPCKGQQRKLGICSEIGLVGFDGMA